MSFFDLTSSVLASSARAWRGTAAFRHNTTQPEKILALYDIEGCPYCRLVREVLCELDIDVMIYPCPKGGMQFRPAALDISGVSQFPLLVDPNTGDSIIESAEIISHLYKYYGGAKGQATSGLRRQVSVASSMLATAYRSLGHARGMYVKSAEHPAQPLELYSFESSPYSRPVRELMCELEIPYRLRNFAKSRWQEMGPPQVRSKFFPEAPISSPNRIRLHELTGRSQVPYLLDPNTGVGMFESADILEYLQETYGC
jgi:glutathione S-transferase